MIQLRRSRVDGPYEKWLTEYWDMSVAQTADIIYLHGGGLLFGTREDLPKSHLKLLTREGYRILALDYPLAPNAKLSHILEDISTSVNMAAKRPYVLFGRSSGAYLSLLISVSGQLRQMPRGIVSYYGYGFLTDGWFDAPSAYYASYPPVEPEVLRVRSQEWYAEGPLPICYPRYVYARQHGCWTKLFYEGAPKDFLRTATLRLTQSLPCPAFFAHSMHDPDVPFSESQQMASRYGGTLFVGMGQRHEFDMEPDSAQTRRLLDQTVKFLHECLSNYSGLGVCGGQIAH